MESGKTDTMLTLGRTCRMYHALIDNPRLWANIETEIEYPRANFMEYLVKYANMVVRLKCKFKHELVYAAKLNEVIAMMPNLVSLNLNECRVFCTASVFAYIPKLVYLNISNCPWLSTTSLVTNMKYIPNLKYFWCEKNSVHQGAYSMYQCITETPKLEVFSCKESGFMAPWIVNRVLHKCPNMRQFFFTSDFSYDTDTTKLQWYHLVCRKYSHVEFTKEVKDMVELSMRENNLV